MSPSRLDNKREIPAHFMPSLPQELDDFWKRNCCKDVPLIYTRQVQRTPLLLYTPETETQGLTSLWKVLMRFTGDHVDYRGRRHVDSFQPNLGSVMTRLCKMLSQHEALVHQFDDSTEDMSIELAYSQAEMRALPLKPRQGMWKRISDTIAVRLFGTRRKSVFHLLPLEESLQTPLEMSQFIVGYGILKPKIRDELYLYVCKQLARNHFIESVNKLWLLLYLMASCFPPSERLLPAFKAFLDASPKLFASRVHKVMERTVKTRGRLQPTCSPELEAAKSLRPVEIHVHMMDEQSLTLSIDGATTAEELCDMIIHQLGIKEHFGFHMFVYFNEKVASLGRGPDHIMDSISQCEQICRDRKLSSEEGEWSLFFRKEIFAPYDDTSSDAISTNLIYAQIKRGVFLEEYKFPDDDLLADFLTNVYYIEHGVEMKDQTLLELLRPIIDEELSDSMSHLSDTRNDSDGPNTSHPETLQNGEGHEGEESGQGEGGSGEDEQGTGVSGDGGQGTGAGGETGPGGHSSGASEALEPESRVRFEDAADTGDGYSTIHESDQHRRTHPDTEDSVHTALEAFDNIHGDGSEADAAAVSTPRRSVFEEWKEKIQSAFAAKYNSLTQLENTFAVKLSIIEYARKNWSLSFARYYDVICTKDGRVMDGIFKMAVTSASLVFIGDNELIVEEVPFSDVLQISEERISELPDSTSILVFTALDQHVYYVTSGDVDDIKDLVTYIMHELITRSSYAIASTSHTAAAVEDVDVDVGDLIFIQKSTRSRKSQLLLQNAENLGLLVKNLRSGQMGLISKKYITLLPLREKPSLEYVERYRATLINPAPSNQTPVQKQARSQARSQTRSKRVEVPPLNLSNSTPSDSGPNTLERRSRRKKRPAPPPPSSPGPLAMSTPRDPPTATPTQQYSEVITADVHYVPVHDSEMHLQNAPSKDSTEHDAPNVLVPRLVSGDDSTPDLVHLDHNGPMYGSDADTSVPETGHDVLAEDTAACDDTEEGQNSATSHGESLEESRGDQNVPIIKEENGCDESQANNGLDENENTKAVANSYETHEPLMMDGSNEDHDELDQSRNSDANIAEVEDLFNQLNSSADPDSVDPDELGQTTTYL